MYKDRKRINKNGYIVVEYPEHPKAFDTGTGMIGVYEHVLIAEEEVLDRSLKPGEVVHHLDSNRSNNSPDNLLPIENPSHAKLHSWLSKNVIIPKPDYQERKDLGCIRCKVCERPVRYGMTYCSPQCYGLDDTECRHKYKHPNKEELEKLIWTKPTTHIAKEYSVSDKAIDNLCKKLGVNKPERGFWRLVETGKVCLIPVD
jgi:hypothetical protein